MMWATDLSNKAFSMLKYIPSISTFIRPFMMKLHWILFILFILSFLLLICCGTLHDLHMLNHTCSPGMKPTWS
jgi:hypothetical protein